MRLVPRSAFRAGGVVVAVIGFGITRVFVSEAVHLGSSLSYLVSGIVPMLIGLGLTIYGVALAVGPFSESYVNTVAQWCIAGTIGMLVVIGVTAIDGIIGGSATETVFQSRQLVANVLLGGAVGGVLIGTRSAANEAQRQEIQRQVNRTRLFNRLLRHEVINAVTIIKGHIDLVSDTERAGRESVESIQGAAERIGKTIDEIGQLHDDPVGDDPVEMGPLVREAVEQVQSEFPDLDIRYEPPPGASTAAADERFRRVIGELLANAAQSATNRVEVRLRLQTDKLTLEISDDGSGLPEMQRHLLESGRFPEYDDPGAGFGLQIVRLLVTRFGGEINVDSGLGDSGTTIEVGIPRNGGGGELGRAVSVTFPNLNRAVVAGLLAGGVMGVFFSLTTDLLPVIGALYAVEDPIVGWVTHLFHSVVFAVLFAAGISHARVASSVTGPLRHALAGIAWGIVLWLVAAGLIMPLWLRLIGLPTSLPNLPNLGLTSHTLWGIVLGLSFYLLGRFGRTDGSD